MYWLHISLIFSYGPQEAPNDRLTYYKSQGFDVEEVKDIPLANEGQNSFDVWGFNTVDDAVDMMRMQRKRLLTVQANKKASESGLTLMATVKENKVNSLDVLKKLMKKPQIASLHFLKSKQAQVLIQQKEKRDQAAKVNEEKTLQELDDDEMNSVRGRVSFITELSTQTNLKHMHVGTRGGCALFRALENNSVVTKIVLSKARLTDATIEVLAGVLHTLTVIYE